MKGSSMFLLIFCLLPSILGRSTDRGPRDKKRVAIIGAGPSGLIAAKYLSSKPEKFDVTVFERNDEVGGMWVYTNATGLDEDGLPVHSSAYNNLRILVAKDNMVLAGFPYPDIPGPSFIHQAFVRQYLQNFTHHFNLYPYIKFHTLVTLVEPETSPSGQIIYKVTYTDLISKAEDFNYFDAVVVCNGRFSAPSIPVIPGSQTFPGSIIHSHQYRHPENYKGRRVCILGAGASGIDIANDVSKHADKVYLSHNRGYLENLVFSSNNVEQRWGIITINGSTLILKDGSTIEADDIIYCTGYKFSYPFLSDKIELSTADNHVEPLYKHLIHIEMPNLFFMGLPEKICNFLVNDAHAQWILALLEGRRELPSKEEMRLDMEQEKQKLLDMGVPLRIILRFRERAWIYFSTILEAAQLPPLSPRVKLIDDYTLATRNADWLTYKNYRYQVINETDIQVQYCELEPNSTPIGPWTCKDVEIISTNKMN